MTKACCIEPVYDEIVAAIASARQKTEKISKLIVNDLYYQYGYCERPEHHVLLLYEAAATTHLNELSAGVEPCLGCEEIRNVVEGIRGIVGEFCDCSEKIPELEVDKSAFAQWAIDHPDCVPYKTWETAIYAECNRVGLRIVVENLDLTCQRFVLHRRASEVLCKIPHQKLVEEILCDVEIKPKPISADCEIQYALLPEEVKCDIDIATFATLIDCGLGTELIAQSIACGLGFNITATGVTICDGADDEATIIQL